jgi:hypothetical protein
MTRGVVYQQVDVKQQKRVATNVCDFPNHVRRIISASIIEEVRTHFHVDS